jgi:hypothetical protein
MRQVDVKVKGIECQGASLEVRCSRWEEFQFGGWSCSEGPFSIFRDGAVICDL